jgi:hypothetical protein
MQLPEFERVTLNVHEDWNLGCHPIVTKIGAKRTKTGQLQEIEMDRYVTAGKGI